MTLPSCLEPENARITIPMALAVAYAIYHWCRRRIERQKIDEDDLPVAKSDKQPTTQSVQSSPAPTPPPSKPVETISIPTPSPAELEEAERLWTEACNIIHSEAPDFATDWHYLTLLYKAAELGSLKAMSKLGDHAYAREDLVEAFYWKLRVEMLGGVSRNPSTSEILQAWKYAGCPAEYENTTVGFSEQKGVFARAVLSLRGGIDLSAARMHLNELIAADNLDAISFLHRKV